MCGIAGIVDTNPGSISLDRLRKMTDIISHRGPDGEGLWISASNQVALGHRRLSIIDLSDSGKQPMHYLSRYTITFNGEIYNYIEIKESLIKKGYKFHSSSDTEVLLALYDAEKENCLNLLDGMFSFAIWDEKENTLFFARDRFGEKPFHYAYKKGAYFVFGSEMKELWAYGVEKVINYGMLYRYLTNNELLNQQNLAETFYEEIFRLEAAHYGKLHLPELDLKITRYWNLDIRQPDTTISAVAAQTRFRELFTTSVKRRLRSDVPVGSSLSGGLDSSLVVCVIDELNKGQEIRQNTFSARFPGFKKDEGNFMQMVIDKTNVSPHFTFPDENDLIKNLQQLIWHQEEPFGSASIFVQYEVMKLAKENNVTVLLDGQGADEILAGYHIYYYAYFRELRRKSKQAYNQQLGYYQQLQENGPMNAVQYKPGLKSWMREILPDAIIRKMKEQQLKQANKKVPFLNKDFFDANFKNNAYSQQVVFDSLNHALYESTMGSGLQELLRYADRNSMAHSREVRLPFLSHELVEFLFTLPAQFKINNGWTKFIMRETFNDLLPTEIAWRKDKIGYEPPQNNWMENKELQEMIRGYEEKLVQERILDANSISAKNSHFANRDWQILMSGSLL